MNPRESAGVEKIRAARASVWSAVFLTIIKGIVGFATGSLGILAEALHSLLDFGAASMTLFSVSYSERPADSSHHYGHGKIENLSALGEAGLLLVTCLWILWEAIERLLGKTGIHVEASIWGFLVMGTSIGVDWYRSRRLMRAARLYRSQALEADALHFSSDILSSMVVIVGLAGVRFGFPKADPIAALFVSFWVAGITMRLAWRSVRDLMDTAPHRAREAVKDAVEAVEGVEHVAEVRVRQAGPKTFADLRVRMDRRLSLEQAHRLADEAEEAVHKVLPEADVVVHTEPISTSTSLATAGGPIRDAFESVATEMNVRFHHMRLFEGPEGTTALVDLEFPGSLSLETARERADSLEKAVLARVPVLHDVIAHIDVDYSDKDRVAGTTEVPGGVPSAKLVEGIVMKVPDVTGCHDILFTEYHGESGGGDGGEAGGLVLSIHISVTPNLSVADSHSISLKVEDALYRRFRTLRKVHIHQEPETLNRKEPEGS